MAMTESPELKFAVQHGLGMKALMGCFVCMSFSGSVVELFGDRVALVLGDTHHRLSLR